MRATTSCVMVSSTISRQIVGRLPNSSASAGELCHHTAPSSHDSPGDTGEVKPSFGRLPAFSFRVISGGGRLPLSRYPGFLIALLARGDALVGGDRDGDPALREGLGDDLFAGLIRMRGLLGCGVLDFDEEEADGTLNCPCAELLELDDDEDEADGTENLAIVDYRATCTCCLQ